MADRSSDTIQSVRRAFDVVECLEELQGATVSEAKEHLDIPKSTAYIHLKTLRECGYLIQEGDEYRIGLRFLKHGGFARHRTELFRVAKPNVDELARDLGEIAALGVEENGKRVLLYKNEGPGAIGENLPTGEYSHMHWVATGKVILAHLPEERVERIVDQHGLPAATEGTIDDRESLFQELEKVRERGYAMESEDRFSGIQGVALPVLDSNDDVIGGLGVAGPRHRVTEERIAGEILDSMREAVNVIELEFNYY
jgi:DNA-binding IclR family transcriptional regulator